MIVVAWAAVAVFVAVNAAVLTLGAMAARADRRWADIEAEQRARDRHPSSSPPHPRHRT